MLSILQMINLLLLLIILTILLYRNHENKLVISLFIIMCNHIYLYDNNPINNFKEENTNGWIHKYKNKKRPKRKNANNKKNKTTTKASTNYLMQHSTKWSTKNLK